jgi:transcriptional regulator with XRE-family HTH domain
MKSLAIGQKLRKIRELKDYKQAYVARQLGISAVAYGKIERGECDVTLSRLNRIAEIFEVPVLQVLSFDESGLFRPRQQVGSFNEVPKIDIASAPSSELAALLKQVAELLENVSHRV